MKARTAWLAMAALAAGILGGCDSFSLLDQFLLNGGLKLAPGTGELRPGETSQLYPAGGTGPYSLFHIDDGLYADGTPIDVGLLSDGGPGYSYTAGESIGKVLIQLRDSNGFSTSTTITVLPHAPTSVLADETEPGPQNVRISWSYPYADRIEGFFIWRSKAGAPYSLLPDAASLPKTATSFIDSGASPSGQNIYRVYAFAGAYSSSTYGEDSSIGQP